MVVVDVDWSLFFFVWCCVVLLCFCFVCSGGCCFFNVACALLVTSLLVACMDRIGLMGQYLARVGMADGVLCTTACQ